jgi:hypothetical protein
MLPDVLFHNIKTPVFTLRPVPGNITHCLPGTTVMDISMILEGKSSPLYFKSWKMCPKPELNLKFERKLKWPLQIFGYG